MLRAGLRIGSEGGLLEATVEDVRVYPIGTEPGFATLDEAVASLASELTAHSGDRTTYVGDAIVDVKLSYRTRQPVYEYALSTSLDPGLPGQEDTANLILDYGPGGVQVYRARGLLVEPP